LAYFKQGGKTVIMDDTEKKKDTKGIPWHPAFVVALQATLIDYRDDLEYELEHPLTSEPLRIDVLVVKKRPEAVVKRQIAEIFRQYNIVEYKSPSDSLSINEFHKAFARANLYKALTRKVEVPELTLSFVVASYPRGLFHYLQKTLGYGVAERHSGIHVVTGAMMPIQIINTVKLSEEENIWLRNLNRNLAEEGLRWLRRLEREYGKLIDPGAYLYAVLTANQDKLSKEDFLMLTARTRKIIEEIGWGEEWRRKGELKGRQEGELKGRQEGRLEGRQEGELKGKLETARAMFTEGDSIEKIARVTGISRKTLKAKLSI
jgi:hypothetical protein